MKGFYKMLITGIIKDAFQEYEKEHSLVLFSHGCNFACKECHNYSQITDSSKIIGQAMQVIDKNLNILHTAVVFLGGQPTIYNQLYSLCRYVKLIKNKKVKIYTNGSNYELIQRIHKDGYLDSISIDFKCLYDCNNVVGCSLSDQEYLMTINKHIELFKNTKYRNIYVELRTTKWECIQEQLKQIESYIECLNLPLNFKHIIQRKI